MYYIPYGSLIICTLPTSRAHPFLPALLISQTASPASHFRRLSRVIDSGPYWLISTKLHDAFFLYLTLVGQPPELSVVASYSISLFDTPVEEVRRVNHMSSFACYHQNNFQILNTATLNSSSVFTFGFFFVAFCASFLIFAFRFCIFTFLQKLNNRRAVGDKQPTTHYNRQKDYKSTSR